MIKNKRRFVLSDIWSNDWFAELSHKYKLFWFYLITNCDYSGIWEVKVKEVEYFINQNIDIGEARDLCSNHIYEVNERTWFLTSFLKYQYSEQLNLSNSTVKGAVNELLIKDITEDYLRKLGYSFCYNKGKGKAKKTYFIAGIEKYYFEGGSLEELHLTSGRPPVYLPQDKDKEKDKDESKEKKMFKEKDKKELIELKSIDVKKEYPVLGGLKHQLEEEQMIELLKDNSVAQIREALEGINRTRKYLTNSVYESVKEYMNENQQLPF